MREYMRFVTEILRQLFSSGNFEPHGYCYLWNPRLVWLHVISDSLIAAAYFAIPVVLVLFIRKRRDLPFSWVFPLFGVFIVACGSTHVMEVWNLWHGNYWLAGVIKAATAAASVPTAVLLARLMPEAVDLPSFGDWIKANAALKQEIVERNEAELNLRISEASFREQAELLDLTHDAIFVRSLDGKILYWNRGAERLYGWTRDDARGKVTHEILETRFPKPVEEILAGVIESGSWEGELAHRCQDGSQVTVSSRWALRRDSAGKPLSILESNRDITQRKREEEKFRNLLESAPDAIVIVDSRGRIQLVNAQTERLFGYTRAELSGQRVEMLIPSRYQGSHVTSREEYGRSPHPRAMGAGLELYGRHKDGSEMPVEVSLSPLQTEEGTLISSAIRDVSTRRRTEEEIRKLNSELSRRLSDLSTANRELESFSYSVSHDLRAPLRHIDGFARILKEEHAAELSQEGCRYVDRVLQAANHMGQLVDDLLNLARIGRKEMARQRVRLDELVRGAMDDLPPEVSERQIEWRIEPLAEADSDPGLVKLVLVNLLSNAVKFTRDRQPAVIEVSARETEKGKAFVVRDNGVGFDPKYADKLFGVFQRLHRQEDFAGTGIGLATVQRIIHRHGGEVWAESSPGQGAAFFFTLEPRPRGNHADTSTNGEAKLVRN
jgi:PAS domain S-box-containing protein